MNKRIKCSVSILCLGSMVMLNACEKYLDAKPDKKLVIPTTINDVQALLDNYPRMNGADAGTGEISADDYFLTDETWEGMYTDQYRRMYTWEKDNLFEDGYNDWSELYSTIFYSNTAVEALNELVPVPQNQASWNNVKGQALFYRAKSYFEGSLIWSKAYNESTAATDLGLPLRLSSDFNKEVGRSSVKQTYDQVLKDLEQAILLLPVAVPHVMRPSKAAANALMARVCLSMGKYEQAFFFANSSLQEKSTLIDYNDLQTDDENPFLPYNQEVLHESFISAPDPIYNSNARIVPELLEMYDDNDLRKQLFFAPNEDGSFFFKGSYEGSPNLFSGLATDEVYLMRAECYARDGKIVEALADLNTLLEKRWKIGTFIPFSAASPQEALDIILNERRKELLMRGLRWMDLKRLNNEGANITISRHLNSQIYTLPPGDPRYVLPIPADIIALTGMAQNPR
ncbi:MAG: RagB/SusD family nutrient uptake outer membrane protein [Daejeonella sp.]